MVQGMVNLAFGTPIPIANANAIVITDTVANLQRFETLLKEVDRPALGGMATKFYQLRNGAKASDLVTKLSAILRTLQPQLGAGTSYNADDRTNQVVLITDPRQFPFFDELIAKLDVRADPNTRNEVIPLRHAEAAKLATVLTSVVKGQSQVNSQRQSTRQTVNQPQVPGQPPTLGAPNAAPVPQTITSINSAADSTGQEFSALVTINPDERSNSIVVSGTVDDIRLVHDLIDKLDIVLAQVRIEIVIAEVTLDDNHDSGISQLGLQLEGDKLTGISAAGPSFGLTGTGGTGVATITRPNGTNSVSGAWDLAGLLSLNTTKRKNNTTILTVPAIVTSHGKKATIINGETRPVITGTTTYANSSTAGANSSQITQQPIGTTLTVTPFIGNDGSVQLDLEQELTDVIDNVTVDGNQQYIMGNRKATSYVTAMSGEIHVLGGFRKQIDSKQTNRLGPIPILGDLLGRRTKDKYQQELIFFIRPVVLTNNSNVDNAEALNRVEKLPTRDEIKEKLDPKYQPPKKSTLDKILPK
jgi:general secretion pathway protein D